MHFLGIVNGSHHVQIGRFVEFFLAERSRAFLRMVQRFLKGLRRHPELATLGHKLLDHQGRKRLIELTLIIQCHKSIDLLQQVLL
jgi:hypothetical protein